MNEVYLGDCIEGMKRYPDKYFDLAICDPPYGININHNMGRRKGDKHSGNKPAVWDSNPPKKEYFNELFRVSKNQIIWGANHFISLMPFDSPCWLMLDKKFSEEVSFAQFELAWTSFKSTCKKFEQSPTTSDAKIHPTQKNIKLYEWLLKNYAKEGDKILDTHGGSMSSVIACLKRGFEITCFEIDEEYFDKSQKRIETFLLQGDMFMAKPEIKFIR